MPRTCVSPLGTALRNTLKFIDKLYYNKIIYGIIINTWLNIHIYIIIEICYILLSLYVCLLSPYKRQFDRKLILLTIPCISYEQENKWECMKI